MKECDVGSKIILFKYVYGFFIDALVFLRWCDVGLWKLLEVGWPSVTAPV